MFTHASSISYSTDLISVSLGILSYDITNTPTVMIYGYGIVRKWERTQESSQEEKNNNPERARWPYYVYFENIKYIHDKAYKCVPISELYKDVGTNAFPTTIGTSKDVTRMHYQREKLRITDNAKNYLLKELSKRNCE